MKDSLDIKLFSVNRISEEKGFEVAVFPQAPFGHEVVLRVLSTLKPDEQVATVSDSKDGEFVVLATGSVTLVLALDVAEDICNALRFHQMEKRHEEEEVSAS